MAEELNGEIMERFDELLTASLKDLSNPERLLRSVGKLDGFDIKYIPLSFGKRRGSFCERADFASTTDNYVIPIGIEPRLREKHKLFVTFCIMICLSYRKTQKVMTGERYAGTRQNLS